MNHGELHAIDLIIVGVYLVSMILIGIHFVKRIKNSGDYYVAGRSFGPIVLMATVCATIIGGSGLMGRAGVAYSSGFKAVLTAIPYLLGMFLFSGISSGAAVALIAMAIRQRSNPHSTEAQFVHRMEIPVVWGEIFLLVAFFVGLALGDDGKVRALVAALGGGFWTWWFWLGVAGLGLIVPMLLKPWVNRSSGIPAVLAACGASLVGVLMLRFFILYAGQLTVA